MKSAKVPKSVIECYKILPDSIQQLEGGMINTTFYCQTVGSKGADVIVQRLGPMFNAAIANDFDVITRHLSAEGWEVPTLVQAQQGEATHTDLEGNIWRASTYISHDSRQPTLDPATLTAIGSCLGELHVSLSKLDYTPSHHIEHFHETEYFAAKLKSDAHKITDQIAQQLVSETLALSRSLPDLMDIGSDQLIHGDPRIANILFRANRPITFIDWDTAMIGSVWIDIGDFCRAFIESSIERGEQVSKEQLASIASGYTRARQLDLDQDLFLDSLLTATKAIALELTMRFLDDIVDPYFTYDETKYPDRLTFDMERANIQMQIIHNIDQLVGSKKRYKAVIFDFFDVLHHDPYLQLLQESGKEAHSSTYQSMCEKLDLGHIDYAQYMEDFADYLGAHLPRVQKRVQKLARMVEGMPELVYGLQSNYKTALLSNAGEEELHHLLDKNGLWDHFDEVIISSSLGMKKPDPQIFNVTLERLGVTADETIFVDDNADNVAAATALGIKGIVFTDHSSLLADLQHLGITLAGTAA